MKTVIYTRFSSDMQRTDSCVDQERNVRAGLQRLGVAMNDVEVVRDEAVSGTKENRRGYSSIIERVERGEPLLLAVDDQSRLSRGDMAKALIKDIVYAGGRFISVGENIDTERDGWEVLVGISEIHSSLTINDLGRRVRRGQAGRVLDENGSAGDFPFGYRSEYVDPHPDLNARHSRPKKKVVINEEEAKWVRKVFEWFNDGRSINGIARELTRLGVDKGHRSTRPGWHHHQVRRILGREKYIGVWRWGETRTVRNSAGRRKQKPAESDEIVEVKRPDLRIIDDDTWQRAQRRLAELHAIHGYKPHQRPRRPKSHYTDKYPKSILGGLLFCGECGSRLVYQQGGKYVYYGCPKHRKGMCSMTVRVPEPKGEEALIGFLRDRLLNSSEWIGKVIESARARMEEMGRAAPAELEAMKKELARIEREAENLADAIASGYPGLERLKRNLAERDGKIAVLLSDIDRLEKRQSVSLSFPSEEWIESQLQDLAGILGEDVTRTALIMREIFGQVVVREMPIPGKSRGWIQLRFRLNGCAALLEAAKGDGEKRAALELSAGDGQSEETVIDLTSPTNMDRWAPKIAEMRAQNPPVTWKEISAVTGIGLGNAHNVWKRYVDAVEAESEPETESQNG